MSCFISVIICTYNRSQELKIVLESLLSQKDDYLIHEIIVVDNNSSDCIKDVLIDAAPKFSGKLKYVYEPHQGKSHAVNTAIRLSTGNIICMTDDDVILDQSWISRIAGCFKQYNCDCIGGRVLPMFPPGTAQWVKDNASKLSGCVVIYDYGDKTYEYKGETFPFIGANCAFKKEVFKQVGFFRTDLGVGTGTVGEDTEFIDRLLRHGKTLYYCGEALIWHPFDSKRLTLKHMALWNISFGKYSTKIALEKKTKFIYYFGIPRYLVREIIKDFFKLISFSWSKPTFFISWRNLFYKAGMIYEYRKSYRKGGKPCLKSA